MQSKGAQNFAQQVVLIVCNNPNQLTSGYNSSVTNNRRVVKKQTRGNSVSSKESDSDEEKTKNNKTNANNLKSLSLRQKPRLKLNEPDDGKKTPKMNNLKDQISPRRRA